MLHARIILDNIQPYKLCKTADLFLSLFLEVVVRKCSVKKCSENFKNLRRKHVCWTLFFNKAE